MKDACAGRPSNGCRRRMPPPPAKLRTPLHGSHRSGRKPTLHYWSVADVQRPRIDLSDECRLEFPAGPREIGIFIQARSGTGFGRRRSSATTLTGTLGLPGIPAIVICKGGCVQSTTASRGCTESLRTEWTCSANKPSVRSCTVKIQLATG